MSHCQPGQAPVQSQLGKNSAPGQSGPVVTAGVASSHIRAPGCPRARVITVSDRSFAGERGDRSGPLLANLLAELGYLVDGPVVVPDDVAAITAELYRSIESEYDLVFTTGGTGVAPRDVTPEATLAVVEREVPGIAELLRSSVAQRVPTSWLSRGIAGTAGHTLVVNLAGSTGAVRDGISALSPLLGHVISQLHGGDHHEA